MQQALTTCTITSAPLCDHTHPENPGLGGGYRSWGGARGVAVALFASLCLLLWYALERSLQRKLFYNLCYVLRNF